MILFCSKCNCEYSESIKCPQCKKGWMKYKNNLYWRETKIELPPRQLTVKYSQVPCLVIHNSEIKILAFNHEHLCWDDEHYDDYYCDIKDVSHWMPLPSLPDRKYNNKGE